MVVGGALVVKDESLFQRLKFLQNAAGAVPVRRIAFYYCEGLKRWLCAWNATAPMHWQ